MVNKERWDVCPQWDDKNNFECFLIDSGLWRMEAKKYNAPIFGKPLFIAKPKGEKTVPSFGDQRNFFTGLMEAEWRNDNFVFADGTTRNPQRPKKIEMFMKILEEIENRASIKDTEKGISYYLEKFKNGVEKNEDTNK